MDKLFQSKLSKMTKITIVGMGKTNRVGGVSTGNLKKDERCWLYLCIFSREDFERFRVFRKSRTRICFVSRPKENTLQFKKRETRENDHINVRILHINWYETT